MFELNNIISAVEEAAEIMINERGDKGIEVKSSRHDLVTMYDKKIQEKLYELLSRDFPDAGFLGEEQLTKPANGGGTFIIDPIDGTTNFIKGLNHSAISVGYLLGNEMKYGVVYDPYKDELFSAEAGKGAFLNGEPIHVSEEPIERSIAHYGTSPYIAELSAKSFKLVEKITRKVIDSRRFGAATLDFCDLACGRAEIFVEYSLCPWDVAAGSLIAREAGAIVTDASGNPLQYSEKTSVVACTKQSYDEVMEIVRGMEY